MTGTAPHLYCPACGRHIVTSAAFCRECGHDLTARGEPAGRTLEPSGGPGTTACPHCDADVPVAAVFCGTCGNAVTPGDLPADSTTSLIPSLVPESPEPDPAPTIDDPTPAWRLNRRSAGIAAAALLVVAGGIGAVLTLSGGSSSTAAKAAHAGTPSVSADVVVTPAATIATATPEATVAVATPTPEPTVDTDAQAPSTDASLTAQVRQLDGLLRLSEQGRAAAVAGDTAAAAANRSTLLRKLQSLRAGATDARLAAAVDAFTAAIRESLRQNRTCGSRCSTADLARVARMKRDALNELNPLLRRYVGHTYRAGEI